VRLSLEDLQREAAAAGFRAEPLEKALRLLEVLEALRKAADSRPACFRSSHMRSSS